MGCFAKGCLTILILGFLCIAGVIGTSWYVFHKLASNNLISDAPTPVQLEQPTEAQYQGADTSFAKLKAAANERREETVAFTAADLNALLARHSDFRDLSGHARVEIADSTMTISLSAPLDGFLWSSKKRRWFNGIVRFTGGYENGEFQINIDSARGGEYEVPDYILSRVNKNLSRVISDNTDEWRHEAGIDLRRVKRMSIKGDKLIVTTKAE
ncbi:MAG: hypothetical protein QOI07_1037 [Verrucomicrobiota bacterium]